ncbi:hypothetical protein [Zavarzinella formosa]|uniref:hypothetical protein n=1 Tax=Zavarzinella formosa TaxID=360055 RepID=UPI00037F1054|nr:hypothetical protein [Zavarzinella formosa]
MRISLRALLAVGVLAFGATMVFLRDKPPGPSDVEQTPPMEEAARPKEVARILKLLPSIPSKESPDAIIKYLGLPREFDRGSSDGESFLMIWDITPEYQFMLGYAREFAPGKPPLKLYEASFSLRWNLGSPDLATCMVYPYWTQEGMVSSADDSKRR